MQETQNMIDDIIISVWIIEWEQQNRILKAIKECLSICHPSVVSWGHLNAQNQCQNMHLQTASRHDAYANVMTLTLTLMRHSWLQFMTSECTQMTSCSTDTLNPLFHLRYKKNFSCKEKCLELQSMFESQSIIYYAPLVISCNYLGSKDA